MRSLIRFTLIAAAASFAAAAASAQAVPVPFASTFAGLATGSTSTTVCATGYPTFVATGTGANYGDGCPATQASVSAPVGVAIDKLGNVFIADQTHNLVRVVYNSGAALSAAIVAANPHIANLTPTKGSIYTIVGGPQSASGITVAPFYCSESATTGGIAGVDKYLNGCPGAQTYVQPRGLAVDNDGNLFISNVATESTIRVFYVGGSAASKLITTEVPAVTSPQAGFVYLIGGTSSTTYSGDGGPATSSTAGKASMNTPRGLFIDANETITFADQANNVVRRIDGTTGIISTVAGHCVVSGTTCTATASSGDGAPATDPSVNIYFPYDVNFDQYGNMFIAEGGSASVPSGRVRVVYAGGTLPGISNPTVGNIYTYAGASAASGTPAQMATFQGVYGISLDPSGYVYVTDYRITGSTTGNHIWRIDPTNGNIIPYVGSGGAVLANTSHCQRNTPQVGLISSDNYGDNCPSTQAYLNQPQGRLVFDGSGNGYFADRSDNIVRKLSFNNVFPATPVGTAATALPQAFYFPTLTTLLTETTALQGQATSEFTAGGGVDTCPVNTLMNVSSNTCVSYVTFKPAVVGLRSGSYSNTDATGTIANETLAGVGLAPLLTLDPTSATALGSGIAPTSVSTDLKGNAYISDSTAKQVLRSSLASPAGTAAITGLGRPQQSTTDSFGNLFVADSANNAIAELTAAGTKVTLPTTGLSAPQGVAADRNGNLYIADTGNNRLVLFSIADNTQTVVSAYPLTLAAPTQLFLDASANLFIIDSGNKRLVELAPNQFAAVVALPNGTVPTAVAADLGGTLYIADTTTGSVFTLAPGSAVGTPVISNLTHPVSIALDPSGNLYLADSAASSVSGYNRSNGTVTFGTTNLGSTSLPVTLTLSNFGNVAAALATPPYVESGTNAAAFIPIAPATCTAGLNLNAGSTCTQSFSFKPTSTTTPQSAQVTLSTTTGQTAVSNFNAAVTNIIPTSLTVVGPTGQLTYGQTATYAVTLVPQSTGTATPTGSITFTVNGKTISTVNVTTSPYTYTFSTQPPTGTNSITFTYSGDANYATSNNSSSLTIAQTATTTTISSTQTATGTVFSAVVTPAVTGAPLPPSGNVLIYVDNVVIATMPVGTGTVTTTKVLSDGAHTYKATYTGDTNYLTSTSTTQSLTISRAVTQLTLTATPSTVNGVSGELLTATVSSATPGLISGSVSFSNGTATLSVVSLPASGVVTYFVPIAIGTTYDLSATYSGDGLYQPSTGNVRSDFAIVSPTGGLSVVDGAQATTTFNVVPLNGYTGSFTAKCSDLPANTLCRFTPVPLAIISTATFAMTVQVFTGIDPTLAGFGGIRNHMLATVCFTILFAGAGALFFRRRTLPLLALVVLLAATAGLSGCGSSVPGTSGNFNTPAGTTTITVTVTDANGIAHTGALALTVVSNGHD